MNRTKLKNYAPQARRDFIQAVTDRAAFYGLSAKKTEPVIEQGDVAIIGGRAFPRSVVPKRQSLIGRIERQGFQQTMEAMAYTWFNRFVAIRFMELHGYFDHGYRVLSHPENKQTPEILEHAEHVELPGLDRDKVIELKLDGRKEQELYRMLLVAQCNALHAAMPFLFEKIDDETELLLPDNLLHSDSLIRRLVREIDEEDWRQVEIIGWLYQFYISEKKDEVIGKVVKSEDIPAATQLFTPNWIVKYLVQNSVGRMWLQTYPDSPLRSKMEYYIEPAEQTEEVKAELAAITPAAIDPETITVLDPACGSGHILVEAYDLLKEIYLERGYRLRDIPRLILSKNLFGLDIDDRAAQLAAFALLMKARADDRRIFERMNEERGATSENGSYSAFPNVLAIQESAHLNVEQLVSDLLNAPAQPKPMIDNGQLFNDFSMQPSVVIENAKTAKSVDPAIFNLQSSISNLLLLFRDAKTFGSLISVPDDIARGLPAIEALVNEQLQSENLLEHSIGDAVLPFVKQARIMAREYDCVITNPPYMGRKFFNPRVKQSLKVAFPNNREDLYGCFIQRNLDLCKRHGSAALITWQTWMFQPTYEKIREYIVSYHVIDSLVHNGRGVFGSDFGSCAFVIRKHHLPSHKGNFRRLFENQGSVLSNEDLAVRFFQSNDFVVSTADFKKIPTSPITYHASRKVLDIFSQSPNLEVIGKPCSGIQTGDNDFFLKQWFEVSIKRIGFGVTDNEQAKQSGFKWFPHKKGGDFRRWYGNCDYVMDWENGGSKIISHPSARPQNISFLFKESVTWSHTSISAFSARYSEAGFTFNVEGPSFFSESPKFFLGYFCSNVVLHFMTLMNPALHFLVGTVALLPYDEKKVQPTKSQVEELTEQCIAIARSDWDSLETAWGFEAFPLLRSDLRAATAKQSFLNWHAHCQANIRRMQELETENNRLFIEAYGLQDELSPEVPEDQITLARADREADIRRLVSYAVGCMMGRYSLDRPGLVYAESGGVGFDPSAYVTFPADADGIAPAMDAEWFADDAANRFVEFIGKAWPAERYSTGSGSDLVDSAVSKLADPVATAPGTVPTARLLEENLRYVAESLNPARNEEPRETIRRYFAQSFFKDHLKTYKKRPIYWLFSSGKQRAFQCLVYLHRYHEGTLARMRTEYVIPLQGKLAARIQQLETGKSASTSTSHRKKIEKEQDTLKKQQAELVAFDEKLRHFADQRIRLDLDDGVKVNYGKFGDLLAEVKTITGGGEE